MKIILSVLVFALTLSLSHRTLAEGGGHGGGHENISERMNALFPPKKADPKQRDLPAKTELEAPAFYAKISGGQTSLKWKAVEGADAYHLQVATDPNFKWLKVDEFFLKDTTFALSSLEPGLHYYWRVNAVKTNNEPLFRKSGFVMSMFETTGAPAETATK